MRVRRVKSMAVDVMSRARRMPLGHPWNRGYPNNRILREQRAVLLGERATNETIVMGGER